MSETKKCLIERAKLAEQVERYDDMAATMKRVVEMTPVLSEEERNLLAVAYRKFIGRRLVAWRILRHIGQKTKGSEERQQMAKEYCGKVESELKPIFADTLALLDQLLIQVEDNPDSKAFYLDMRADVYIFIAEVEGICHIGRLADKDLQAIFRHLPPCDRWLASEVCEKWRDLSAEPWRDVINLDLSQVPTENIHDVIRKCPNRASVSARWQSLGDLRRFFSRLTPLVSSVQCIGCEFTVPHTAHPFNVKASLRNSQLRELIWHRSRTIRLCESGPGTEYLMPLSLPYTLRRLELVTLDGHISAFCVDAFDLPLLESVIFASLNIRQIRDVPAKDFLHSGPGVRVLEGLHASITLREAYLDAPLPSTSTEMVFALAMLEFLFVNNVTFAPEHMVRLITQHRSLRILVLTASRASDFNGEVVIPVRKRFPNGFDADPVPQLLLFLGKVASQRLRFTPSESDALKIHPIDAPLPQFLEKEGVKSTFQDSWIASRIREFAENEEGLVDYCFEGNAESILYTQ